jgi:hypothetical protein
MRIDFSSLRINFGKAGVATREKMLRGQSRKRCCELAALEHGSGFSKSSQGGSSLIRWIFFQMDIL